MGLHFTAAGQARFSALTKQAVDKGEAANEIEYLAVVVDNHVLITASITSRITGEAVLSGAGFDRDHVERMPPNSAPGCCRSR